MNDSEVDVIARRRKNGWKILFFRREILISNLQKKNFSSTFFPEKGDGAGWEWIRPLILNSTSWVVSAHRSAHAHNVLYKVGALTCRGVLKIGKYIYPSRRFATKFVTGNCCGHETFKICFLQIFPFRNSHKILVNLHSNDCEKFDIL